VAATPFPRDKPPHGWNAIDWELAHHWLTRRLVT
jgi:hypothetical protein